MKEPKSWDAVNGTAHLRDGRTLPKMAPPKGRASRMVNSYLDPDDYRKFYELCMARNISGAELIRQLVRDAFR